MGNVPQGLAARTPIVAYLFDSADKSGFSHSWILLCKRVSAIRSTRVRVRGAECSGSGLSPRCASAPRWSRAVRNDRSKSETTVKFWDKKRPVVVARLLRVRVPYKQNQTFISLKVLTAIRAAQIPTPTRHQPGRSPQKDFSGRGSSLFLSSSFSLEGTELVVHTSFGKTTGGGSVMLLFS